MEFYIVKSHMGKLIGIQRVNRKFTLGQILYNTNKERFILASELLFGSFIGYNNRIIESDYFSPEDVILIETHCRPDFEVSWEEALNIRTYRALKEAYVWFRGMELLLDFKK
jgi:hypothetical protein